MSAKCDYCGNYRDESCVCPGCYEETVTRLESEIERLREENKRLREQVKDAEAELRKAIASCIRDRKRAEEHGAIEAIGFMTAHLAPNEHPEKYLQLWRDGRK